MHVKLAKIGNSRGVRLPKSVIEQAGLGEDLELEVLGQSVILHPARTIRAHWADDAKRCHDAHEDDLADWDATVTDFEGEWE